MSKYIDAEKLIAEIERRKDKYDPHYTNAGRELEELISFTKSFQQEQPELPGYDKALLEVKSKVDELYDEAGIGCCEYDCGLYNGIAETCMRLRGFIKARLGSDEQPESARDKFVFPKFLYARTLDNKTIDVSYGPQDMTAIEYVRNDFVAQEHTDMDLEKEIDEYYHKNLGFILSPIDTRTIVEYIARHFYELGKKSK